MILKNLLLIDGINRSGKKSITDAITSFKKSESIEMSYVFEHIIEGLSLKLISKKFAKSFFEKFLNEIAYNKMLGRNSNFRKEDKSSIQNFSFPNIYKKRLLIKNEGENIFLKLKQTNNFFPFMTHEILTNLDMLDALKIKYKMISMFRNPYDLVYSWSQRNIVKNFGEKNFTLSFNYKKKVYPWYVHNTHKKWLKLNNFDKTAIIVTDLIERSIRQYNKSKNKKDIFLIKYEDYILNSVSVLKKICKFLNTNFSSQTYRKLKILKLPSKKINLKKKRDLKINFIKKRVDPRLFKKIEKLEKNYSKNFYGFQKIYEIL